MPAGRNRQYNPRTGTWTRPKPWYEKKRKSTRKSSKKNGCYVATAVYGSYDCPEVWTLRRYRDYYLSKSFFGRSFINTYYSVSPVFVRLFGHKKWFNTFFRNKLDKIVSWLSDKGYSSDKYDDIDW